MRGFLEIMDMEKDVDIKFQMIVLQSMQVNGWWLID